MEIIPIGVVRSPYKTPEEAPKQGKNTPALAEIQIEEKFVRGLDGIEAHPYLIVMYWAHQIDRGRAISDLFVIEKQRGTFATRSPKRPNPICLCLVKLIKREKNKLIVQWLDALDGSPVIDVKPYFPKIDSP
ncbi:MAG: tRNA (N6-threonylcarbamoyladenosine(37)-N6)-methyltransferase TrmO [Euryarchaeota archaeon]|nr:tRNA (N6-threonylcarbamoyladenosine(37)-N6)-methyltransferase TrmO [Euryarchaeota archaeon]